MSTHKILIVEDDPADIELTLRALKEHSLGNDIDITRDGVECLDYLYRKGKYVDRNEIEPVLILLDLKMPRKSGIDVLEVLKKDKILKKIPVVVMTSSSQDPDIDSCYELGVNAYVTKPVDFTEFANAIKNVGLFWLVINKTPQLRI